MRFILTLLLTLNMLKAGGILEVVWPKSSTQYQKTMKAYPKVLTDKIKSVKLPVYLPKSYIYNKKMSIVANENFYTITIFLKGATLMITGDKTYQQKIKKGGEKIKRKMKNIDAKFIHSEGMMSTDFNRHGVNYALLLECNSPNKDRRCKESLFLKQIYNELILVGGTR